MEANMTDESWTIRIPAAIAKAEAHLGNRKVRWINVHDDGEGDYITAGEAALAKALWGSRAMILRYLEVLREDDKYTVRLIQCLEGAEAALRAFVEKVEAL